MSTFTDYTGERLGKLVVIEYVGRNNDNRPLWRCKCDCGSEITITSRNISKRNVTSCGCDKREDLTGEKFGRWTVIGKAQKIGRYYYWHCRCDCGNEKDVRERSLKEGTSQSCGCIQRETASKMCSETKRDNLIGKRFGRLEVISRVGYNREHHTTVWKCKCDCGTIKDIEAMALQSGHTQSCGCLHRENVSKMAKTHGLSNTRLYSIWSGMLTRCYCPGDGKTYEKYGARGISVCYEWRTSFESFYNWAINNGYLDTLSIDRIDNDGDYCPENCQWATAKQQANNRRSNILLTYNGETKNASQWGEIIGIPGSVICRRKKRGWSDEECIEIPLCKNQKDAETKKKG